MTSTGILLELDHTMAAKTVFGTFTFGTVGFRKSSIMIDLDFLQFFTETWMRRPDLNDGIYGGWQVIDATPQEPSNCKNFLMTSHSLAKTSLHNPTNFYL